MSPDAQRALVQVVREGGHPAGSFTVEHVDAHIVGGQVHAGGAWVGPKMRIIFSGHAITASGDRITKRTAWEIDGADVGIFLGDLVRAAQDLVRGNRQHAAEDVGA